MIDGYPEESELHDLKALLWKHPINFIEGAKVLVEIFHDTGFGSSKLDEVNETLELNTAGWSGCEDIIGQAQGTLWWSLYWRSTHRGGHYQFARA
jgi:hypothetical protein